MGKIAGCVKKDPNCPRSPNLAQARHRPGQAGQGAGRDPRRDRRQAEAVGRRRRRRRPPRRRGGSKKVVPFAHNLRRGAEGDQGDHRRVQRLPVPVLQAVRADGEGRARQVRQGRRAGVDEPAAAVPRPRHGRRDGVPGRRAPGQRQGLEAARQDVREQHRAHRAPTSRSTRARSASTSASSRRTGTTPRSRPRSTQDQKVGDRGRRQRHARPSSSTAASWSARSRPTRSRRSSTTRSRRRTSCSRRGRRSRTSTRSGWRRPRWRRAAAGGARPAAPEGKQDVKLGDAPVKGPGSAQGDGRRVQRLPVPVLLARRAGAEADRGRVQGQGDASPSSSCRCRSTTRRTWRPRRRWPPTSRASSGRCHDKLFANQQALDRPSLEKYAEELGLNMAQVQGGARLGQVQGQGRRRRQGGRRGRRHRHADLLHQRHEARRRSAVRRLQDRHRQRAEGQGLALLPLPLAGEGRGGASLRRSQRSTALARDVAGSRRAGGRA